MYKFIFLLFFNIISLAKTMSGINHKTVCVHNDMLIHCTGQSLIQIKAASFGTNVTYRPNICAQDLRSTPECYTFRIIQKMCNNKRSCKIAVSHKIFEKSYTTFNGEQYLTVWFKCQHIYQCQPFEEFNVASNKCPITCPPHRYLMLPCGTVPGCDCIEGFVRDHFTRRCVSKSQCPIGNPAGHQWAESYRKCQPPCTEICPFACKRLNQSTCSGILETECKPGYYCDVGFCRDLETRQCIPC